MKKRDIIELIEDWSNNFNQPVLKEKKVPNEERIILAHKLIEEEFGEFETALDNKDWKEVQDALGDLLWVTVRAMMEFGIDPNSTIEEIYNSNMSKLDVDELNAQVTKLKYEKQGIVTYCKQNPQGNYVTYRESDSKVLKSHRWKEPNFLK